MAPSLLPSRSPAFALTAALAAAACGRPSAPPPLPAEDAQASAVEAAAVPPMALAVVALEAVRVGPSADGARTVATARADGEELAVSFATPRRGWRVSAGSEPGVLVAAGGPPGGPNGFSVTVVRTHGDTRSLLDAFAHARAAQPGREPFELGAFEGVTVASRARQAVAFALGRSMARARHCAYLVDVARVSLVVEALTGGSASPRCADVLTEPAIRELTESLTVAPSAR